MIKLYCFSLMSLLIVISSFSIKPSQNEIDLANELETNRNFISSEKLNDKMDQAWQVSWERFYHRKTNQFYDYLISYEKGKELDHLPNANEISRLYPNDCGYGTGMEDCMISAGVMLSMIVDKYDVTKDERLRESAYDVFKGIQLSATVHGIHGFLARGVCVADGISTYICSSRDQYTHAVHGLWCYFHSPLCTVDTKEKIGQILSAIADRMESFVTPENNYSFMRADGTPDVRGISKMWNVKGHEAARLPMFYAAAWNTTGNERYFNLYRKYIKEAVSQSFNIEDVTPTYSFLQMQCSFELLIALENEIDLKNKMKEIMLMVSNKSAERAIRADKNANQLVLTMLTSDWRDGIGINTGSEYRKVWYNVRESGEAALTQIMGQKEHFIDEQRKFLEKAITRLDYNRVSTAGIFYLQGAYWKARKLGIFNESE